MICDVVGGGMKSYYIKDKKGYHVVLAKNAKAARRAIEKAGGKSFIINSDIGTSVLQNTEN